MLKGLTESKEYRHAFIEESIRSRVTAQISALRNERGWDYKAFADALKKKVPWAYRLEDPNSATPTIPTLLEVAEAFDIGLEVRFRSFSELLDDVITLTPESFMVPSFETELRTRSFNKRRSSASSHRKGPKLVRKRKDHSRETVPIGGIGSALGNSALAS